MAPKDRDHTLPAIPEGAAAKPRSSSERWSDPDADDQEEEDLFERDNVVAAFGQVVEEGDGEAAAPASNEYPLRNDGEDNVDRTTNGPFYVQSSSTGDSWELTWPIWHLLPYNERHAIAVQHGMKSIGEFEEYMTLSRAIDESENVDGGRGQAPVVVNVDVGSSSNDDLQSEGVESRDEDAPDASWHPPYIGTVAEEEDEDESSVSTTGEDLTTSDETAEADAEIDIENHLEMIRLGGLPCTIPDEILHKCFAFLPVDDFANLALVSPHWSRFTRCESLYKSLCQRVYLNQSKRKTLQVGRFGNSYRKMLEVRPRVRTGGGLYVLKYQEVRKIQRDMWTEIPVGAILESVYFRYLYFFEDGQVMYALTHATPVEMIPRFHRMLVHGYGSKDKWGVWGRYQIKKDVVRVWVSQAWHDVCFQLRVIPSNKELQYESGDRGMCTSMKLEEHMSSASGNFEEDSYDLVRYDIPLSCYFRYLRDRRL